jgi:Ni,Fe-hydrogenase I small subunit
VGAGHGCIGCANPNFWETPAYETVPIFETTPPDTFPSAEEEEGISPAGAGVIGAAAGLAVGVAGTVAARKMTEDSE